MRKLVRILTFVVATSTGLGVAGGCQEAGKPVDCHQACSKLESCANGELDVDSCHALCGDSESEQHDELSRCTDCLDASYNCSEIADKCPICADVSSALLEAESDGAGGNSGAGGSG